MLYYLFEYLEKQYQFPGATLFQFLTFRAAMAVLLSLILATAYGKRIIDFLKRKQIGETVRDLGLEGQEQKAGTPTMGGIIIIVSTLIPVLLFARLENIYVILLIMTTVWMGIIGFVDDYIKIFKKDKKGLKGRFKVLGQIVLGLMVGAILYFHPAVTMKEKNSSRITSNFTVEQVEGMELKAVRTNVPFFKNNQLDYSDLVSWIGEGASDYAWLVFIPIVIFIVTAVSNGANLTDGIDGLAAGTSAIIVLALGILAWVSGNVIFSDYLDIFFIPRSEELVVFSAAFVGALVGFLWYNAYPAQVFMGDTGSLTIGGVIAVIAIIVRKELLIPILCGIFFAESLSVMVQVSYFKYTRRKYGEGRRIFRMSPIHHHYQKKGYHESKIVTRFWIIGILLAIITIVTLKVRWMIRLVILGGGESGVGTAILGRQKGYEVFLSDKGKIQQKYKDVLEHFGIDWEEGKHSEELIMNADLVMKSPGIADTVPLVVALNAKGVSVVSEIEFAAQFTDASIIGITGSNGKTTTTMLTYHILKNGGLNVGMAGNIGDSFARMVAEKDHDFYVLEISSFQLDGIIKFRPHIAVITNITEDHLDRYDYDFDKYTASKFRIAENQSEEDYLVYDADDTVIAEWMQKHPVRSHTLAFSIERKLPEGAWIEDGNIRINTEQKTISMTNDALALEGKHNLKNTMAAATVAKLVGIRKETIRESIENFQGAPHRLEKVLKIHHVQYINDSKATNVNATYYALESMRTPTVWIVGGIDKGNDYKVLMPLVREKVKAIVCLGLDNTKLREAFGNAVDLFVETYAMSEAVKVAYKIAERGDTVLLSPACASFDLFENYIDRGNQFKEAIKNL